MTSERTPQSALEELGKLLDESGARALVGLRQQGKYQTVAAMRAEFRPWDEIGKAIGWSGDAVERSYEIETRLELDAAQQERDEAQRERDARLDELKRERKTPLTESRVWDLVRYARGYLSTEGLIDLHEYAHLVSDSTGKPPNSPSARRLEEYDALRKRMEAAEAALAKLQALRPQLETAEALAKDPFIREPIRDVLHALPSLSEPSLSNRQE